MSSITIPDVDDALKARLAVRAARRGKSLESEARDILREALAGEESVDRPAHLYAAIRSVVEPLGAVELDTAAQWFARRRSSVGGDADAVPDVARCASRISGASSRTEALAQIPDTAKDRSDA